MSAGTPTPAELRDALRAQVQTSSVGGVARDVGLTPSVLAAFLRGGSPYNHTRRLLMEWWSRERALLPTISATAVEGALAAMLADVAPERRDDALADLTETLDGLRRRHPERCPAWVAELLGGEMTSGAGINARPGVDR
jgi:hypothetical protein